MFDFVVGTLLIYRFHHFSFILFYGVTFVAIYIPGDTHLEIWQFIKVSKLLSSFFPEPLISFLAFNTTYLRRVTQLGSCSCVLNVMHANMFCCFCIGYRKAPLSLHASHVFLASVSHPFFSSFQFLMQCRCKSGTAAFSSHTSTRFCFPWLRILRLQCVQRDIMQDFSVSVG